MSRHWKTCWDEDGPYGELCECAIGDDHDEDETEDNLTEDEGDE